MNRLLLYFLLSTVFICRAAAQLSQVEAKKLSTALFAVSSLYVDSVDNAKLVDNAIVGMLQKLDPHSVYMDAEETKAMNEPLQANFDGIGIQFNMLTDTLYVIQVIPGGPSEKVGILPGDRILLVDDTLIAGVKMKTTDIMKRLRGPQGTEVRVKILRNRNPELLEFKITRGKIPVFSLDAAYMAGKRIGYIKLNRFSASTHEEFQTALNKLQKQGMKSLILDLQGNGGGYLTTAITMADEFLGADQLIVYTEGRRQPREEAKASDKGRFEKGNLVILVDESSASASEILAGAVQDWDRGVIVGRRTFGKGLVQKPISLPDGSMIRLTIARYFTPSGRNIQKPYESGKSDQYNRELSQRLQRGELSAADSIHFPDSLRFATLHAQRTVYGGGGVMPDVFVPLDTAHYTPWHRRVAAAGLINKVAMTYSDSRRDALRKQYPTFNRYKADFQPSDSLLNQLHSDALADSISCDDDEYLRAQPLVRLQIKALLARDLFEMGDYYRIMNDDNLLYREALRLLTDTPAYQQLLQPRPTTRFAQPPS